MSHDDVAVSSSSFEQFLTAMGPKMKRLLAANRIPGEDADDVLQQALLALIYHWDTIRDPESWLLATLRRHCFLYWRNHRRRLYSAVDTTILEWLSQPVSPPQERGDLICDLRQLIERLPARCRSVLELRFLLGYESQEVARRLGYRGSSMTQVTNRCLAALAREMLAAGRGVVPASPVSDGAAPGGAVVGGAAPAGPAAGGSAPVPTSERPAWRPGVGPDSILPSGPRRPRRPRQALR
jgi:RNA polymerase sigma factor (sigma-70 family)